MDTKVVGVGWTKTGTTSLGEALHLLGYKVVGCVGNREPDIARSIGHVVRQYADTHNAFVDLPWPLFYRYLDTCYPGSKFILTVRPPREWLRSAIRFYGPEGSPMFSWAHGGLVNPGSNPVQCMHHYIDHNQSVAGYFVHRPADFLVLDICAGQGWPELCTFLGKDVPAEPFPWKKKQEIK